MTSKAAASIWKHLRAILSLPFMVTVVVPALILWDEPIRIGGEQSVPYRIVLGVLGATLIAAGLLLMFKTISLFATVGEGTLAPWEPTQKLVVRGVYRHVRNPMISGVLSILLGEAALFGSTSVLLWFLAFFAANAIYIPLWEEHGLVRRFGDEYLRYRRNVPRWVPRLRPWIQEGPPGPV